MKASAKADIASGIGNVRQSILKAAKKLTEEAKLTLNNENGAEESELHVLPQLRHTPPAVKQTKVFWKERE